MISTKIVYLPAYTTREFRNYGLYKAGSFYKYLFTKEDNSLLATGAIKLIPFELCTLKTNHKVFLAGKQYNINEDVDCTKFDINVLKTLIKNNVINCSLKDEYKNKDINFIIKKSEVFSLIGKTFQEASEILNIDFNIIKEKFDLKQGGKKKKVTKTDLDKINEIISGV